MSNQEYVADAELFEPRAANGPDGAGESLPVDAPTADEALRTLFGLNDCDLRTYEVLYRSEAKTTRELAERLDRDRSNVNRSLSRLRESGFVTRRRRILQNGGQVYQYVAEHPETVLATAEAGIAAWAETAHERLASHLRGIE